MELDVLSVMHFIVEEKKLATPTTIKNCSVKCGFSNDVSSSNGSMVKPSEDEEGD
jgi:hypothetical protein